MGFFQDLLNSISGKSAQEQAAAVLQAQLNLAQLQLEEQQKEAELKYDPARLEQQAKIAVAIVAGITIIILAYWLIKKYS